MTRNLRRLPFCALFVLGLATASQAQDFGSRWLDEAVNRVMQDTDRELDPLPVQLKAAGGEIVYFDNNIFLRDTDARSDTVFTTFAQLGLLYAEESFDVEADLVANYNIYARSEDLDDDEERGYLRARYQGSWLTAQFTQVIRHESEPIDATFATRNEKIVSNSLPLLVVRFSDDFSLEGEANYQIVRFEERRYDSVENDNLRAWGSLVYATTLGFDLVGQGGYLLIDYQESTSVDGDGYFARAGIRGEILMDLYVELLAGVTEVQSDDFPGTTANEEHSTGDIEAYLRYQASEDLIVSAHYAHRIGFALTGAPFQINDVSGLTLNYKASEDFDIHFRAGYSRYHTTDGLITSYYSGALELRYRVFEHVVLDGGVAFRSSDVNASSTNDADYDNGIVSAGLILVY